jgi:hypothetical protein
MKKPTFDAVDSRVMFVCGIAFVVLVVLLTLGY